MTEEEKKDKVSKKNLRKIIRLTRIFSKKKGPNFADLLETFMIFRY